MNANLKTFGFFIMSVVLIMVVGEANALQQTAAPLNYELQLGESKTLQWGLVSDERVPIILELYAEGAGSELLSFLSSIEALPRQMVLVDITVDVPQDYTNNIELKPAIFALQRGADEGQGGAVINIQMKKVLSIKIGEVMAVQEQEPVIQAEPPPETEDKPQVDPEPTAPSQPGGTTFIIEPEEESEPESTVSNESNGGGCLIATAAYGSEMAHQVQLLREIRDNTLLSTASGTSFMAGFNQLYYSFSPTIADWERQNPVFKEAVRIFITPMLSTLSIMTLANEGSEEAVLGLGISVIALNLGMYIAAPTAIAFTVKRHLKSK